ncbi:acyl-CoA dehydrogenase, N-terminal domain protein [Mycobacterium avium subsp. avium 2285 (R)]|nr:acyl-CoA dehydrogenase, N-terminal domain protein [Mycobacterium avium subsp. avium 2285 (R)]
MARRAQADRGAARDDAGIREYDLAWQRTQWEGGWAGIAWPKEYGGQGLTLMQQLIWYEEYAARGSPASMPASWEIRTPGQP